MNPPRKNERVYSEEHRQGGNPGVVSKIGKRIASHHTILPPSIVTHTDDRPAEARPPRRVISPSRPGPCCTAANERRSQQVRLGEFTSELCICTRCGYAKRRITSLSEREYEDYAERQEKAGRILGNTGRKDQPPKAGEGVEDPEDA